MKRVNVFFGISLTLVILSLIAIFSFGFNLGIDFTGGSKLEIAIASGASTSQINNVLDEFWQTQEVKIAVSPVIQLIGANRYNLKIQEISNEQKNQLLELFTAKLWPTEELNFTTIGPVVGQKLVSSAQKSIILAIIGMILFISYSFRRIPKDISPFMFGLVAIVALLHDIIIVMGAFVLLGKYLGAEVDMLFVTALLTTFGFSVNDTIVVFDRFRENLIKLKKNETVELAANSALNQTLARSINTSGTLVVTLIALLLFGPQPLQFFISALLIGTIIGTYSSIFVATPLLIKLQKNNRI